MDTNSSDIVSQLPADVVENYSKIAVPAPLNSPIPAMDTTDMTPLPATGLDTTPSSDQLDMSDSANWRNGISLSDATDYELLNRRIDDLQKQLNDIDSRNEIALKYLCDNMAWLVKMLSGVAQMAQGLQGMPGMGGMVAKMLGGGKKHD